MADRVEEQLLGFLLGALEDSEQEAMERELTRDPRLRKQLARLRLRLSSLWKTEAEFEPPRGLADRTCKLIASCRREAGEVSAAGRTHRPRSRVRPMAPEPLPAGRSGGLRWLDAAVAVGIVAAASALVFPAIQSSRFNARLSTCQDNLRQVGQALSQYSEKQHGYFPYVPQHGKLAAAGIYAPTLIDCGLLDRSRRVVCPSSPMAEDGLFRVPSTDELLATSDGVKLKRLHEVMGGSYGYCLGYTENGRYRGTRNLGRTFFAVMADAPSLSQPGHQSLNHGGSGQNVLFECGRISFLTHTSFEDRPDDFFVNDYGFVAAGNHSNDSVVGPSGAAPIANVPAYDGWEK